MEKSSLHAWAPRQGLILSFDNKNQPYHWSLASECKSHFFINSTTRSGQFSQAQSWIAYSAVPSESMVGTILLKKNHVWHTCALVVHVTGKLNTHNPHFNCHRDIVTWRHYASSLLIHFKNKFTRSSVFSATFTKTTTSLEYVPFDKFCCCQC